MKISNSKKELARIISENGGWRGVANLALFGKVSGRCYLLKTDEWPEYNTAIMGFYINARDVVSEFPSEPFANWHQTILSREEYFHLYPAQDAYGWIEWNGGECPVAGLSVVDVKYFDMDGFITGIALDFVWGPKTNIVHYRKTCSESESSAKEHKPAPVQEPESKPTIEQLAADYSNRKDYADRKQSEADAAKADAEAKLAELVAAGKAIGLVVSVANIEPGLVITDWRDLKRGDIVWWSGDDAFESGEYPVYDIENIDHEGPCLILISIDDKRQWIDCDLEEWRFIRRP